MSQMPYPHPQPSSPSPPSPPRPILTRPEPVYAGRVSNSPEPEMPTAGDAYYPSTSADRMDNAHRQSTYVTARFDLGTEPAPEHLVHPDPAHSGDHPGGQRGSFLDHVVPSLSEKTVTRQNIRSRVKPTLDSAKGELTKATKKARFTGWTLNVAIGLQVLLGSLTTGLSAVTSAGNIAIATVILGALSTLVASFLAKARGSGEPERWITRRKDLEHFERECEAFLLDNGYKFGIDEPWKSEEEKQGKLMLEHRIHGFRDRLEELLGNTPQEKGPGTTTSAA